MNKQIGITIGVIIFFMLLVIGIAAAQDQVMCLKDVCPACTNNCVMPEIPACPSLTCADNILKVEGLWEVTTNKRLCGEIVLGPSWVIINDETIMLNKVKRMARVESCKGVTE